jgi:hypothetical protein
MLTRYRLGSIFSGTSVCARIIEILDLCRRPMFKKTGNFLSAGPNPTMASYNASVVFFYNATGSIVCFEKKFFYFENTL